MVFLLYKNIMFGKRTFPNMPSYEIQSVRKAASVLRALSREQPEMGVTELSRKLALNRTVVQKLVLTLEREGFLHQDPVSRKYRLGPKIIELAGVFLGTDPLTREGTECIRELANLSGMSVGLGILDGDEVLYLAAVEANTSVKAASRTGDRRPIYATASGKCLLSFLPRVEQESLLARVTLRPLTPNTITDADRLREELATVRERGYATSWEERAIGLIGVAAPVWDHHGRVVAAISMAIPKGFVSEEGFQHNVRLTVEAALTLTRRLGGVSAARSLTE